MASITRSLHSLPAATPTLAAVRQRRTPPHQALLFALGGDAAHAAASRAIINLWSAGLRKFQNNTEGTCCGNEALQAAWVGAKITRAAELLRHTAGSGWTPADTAAFTHMMYTVHLPLLINGSNANGNWAASFFEAQFGIAVFAEDAALFAHAVKAWTDRAPSYWYIASDGAEPPLDPQPNCASTPLLLATTVSATPLQHCHTPLAPSPMYPR